MNKITMYNDMIDYKEGKIFFAANKGYTSELMQRLYDNGYRATTSGCIHYLNDSQGHVVAQGYSWEGLLLQTAIALR